MNPTVAVRPRTSSWWVLLAALLTADIVYGFQQTAVTPALPVVEADLHTNPAWATWLLSGYFIVAVVAPVFLGKLADRSGKRRVFLAALIVFGIGSAIAAAAPSIGVLVIARVIQGAGGVVLPLSFAILRDHATGEQVGRGIGILTGGFGIGSLAGFTIGGLITQELSWRWIFIIGAIALGLAIALVRLTVTPGQAGKARGLDTPGAALFGAAVAALVLALTLGPQQGWGAALVIGLFVVAAAAAGGWVIRELHTPEPLMDPRVLSSRPVLLTNVVSMLAGYAVVGINVLVPFLLVGGGHSRTLTFLGLAAGPLLTGIVLIPRGLGQTAGGLATNPLSRRLGVAPTFALGMLCITAASVGLAAWHDQVWQLLLELAGIGLGWGIATSMSGRIVTLTADPGETSIANSINSVLRRVGGVIGTQVAAILLVTITIHGTPAPVAFTIGFAVAAGLALAGAAGILLVRTPRLHSPTARGQPPGDERAVSPAIHRERPAMPDNLSHVDPAATALLVMDYQPGTVAMLDDPAPLLATVAGAITAVRRSGGHVGYVRVAFTDDDMAQIPERSAMAAAVASRGRAMHVDAPETQIHERLAPQPGDIVVRKVRVGAFSTTDLDARLHERGIDTIVLAGLATSGVVLSTVRDAADRDYRVIVLSDASADREPDVHRFLTTRVFPRQAHVITTSQLRELLPTT